MRAPTPDNSRPSEERTRLAPSPTGALHLGNARTFLVTWALARRRGWRIVLRIEDLDGPRVRTRAADDAIRTLEWLGMDWDEGPVFQSGDLEPYREAMRVLSRRGLAYPSRCTRSELEAVVSAPHAGAREARYPASRRPVLTARQFDDESVPWRFATPEGQVRVEDRFAGSVALDPASGVGDFVVWSARGAPAYQLAVVVDDARQGVTQVIRGDDLLDSAARQLLLMRALELAPEPAYTHLPLVVGGDGRRLAKRHGDTRVEEYRRLGVRAERIVGLAAWWSGAAGERRELAAGELAGALNLDTIPRGAVTFTAEDDAWLRTGA